MKIALVEFLNAYPLYFALKEQIIKNDFQFISQPPSICASLLRENMVDIGNVPIIEYAKSDNYKILNECCIASNKEVKSVVLFLNKPLHKVKVVRLDKNSNTSVALTKILFKFKYKLSVDFTYNKNNADCELIIGDRALEKIKLTPNTPRLDLAVEWNNMTNLPFVFAVWLSNNDSIDKNTASLFIQSKEWGKKHIDQICRVFSKKNDLVNNDECNNYLQTNICYDLTHDKIESIKQFFFYAYKTGIISKIPNISFTC